MRRASLLILFLLRAAFSGAEQSYPELAATIEYRHDAVDYDAPATDFYRSSLRMNLSGKSSCGITTMYMAQGERRCTWNLALLDLAPSAWCIAGHYYAHFGYGLLMGRRMRVSPDEFQMTSELSRGTSFAPCRSGNPLYSFQGIAMGYAFHFRGFSLSVNPFYSMRERYAHCDAEGTLVSDSSLSTLNMRLNRRYPYTLPIIITDAGIMAEMKGGDRVAIQAYWFQTDIKSAGQERVLWDYDRTSYLAGAIRSIYALGLYALYRDEFVSLFAELGLPCREMEQIDGSKRVIRDYGILYGLELRHRYASFLFRGKETGTRFYSQYGRGGNYPEREWYGAVKIIPMEHLILGSAFSFEKGLAPVQEDYSPVTMREKVNVKCLFSDRSWISFRLTRISRDREHRGGESLQGKSVLRLQLSDSFRFGGSALAQRRQGRGISASCGADLTAALFRRLSVSLYYSWFFISTGDSLYRNSSPWRGSVTSGLSVSESSHLAGCGFVYTLGRTRAWLRYSHQFTGGRSVSWRVEAFGSLVL